MTTMAASILQIKNVTKHFFGVKALNDVSFDINKGEIVGLLGANGAGKSTLLKIIGGIQSADSGEILYEGEPLNLKTPHDAQQKGLISVYQELNLFLNMTVAENLFLGRECKDGLGFVDWKKTNKEAEFILKGMGLNIDPCTVVSNLSVARQHLIEIARAINEKPKVLLLDEPTAALSEDQIEWLFKQVRGLVEAGTTVIYVSHRLDEVSEFCSRCVILRDGRLTAILDDEFDKCNIVKNMIGYDVVLEKKAAAKECKDVVFECEGLSVKGKLDDVSFKVGREEILGIAGLVGAGRTDLLRAIYGVDKADSGILKLNGKPLNINHTSDAIKNKIVLISEDRKLEGLFLAEPVKLNLAANTLKDRATVGFIKSKEETKAAKEISGKVSLDKGRLRSPVRMLSGGNQQKVVIGKALLTGADLLLMDEPSRGVDVGAREEIYKIINSLSEEGKGIILVSSDWEELLALSDRVIVMSEGRLTQELSGDAITEENIMHASTIANLNKAEKAVKNGSPIKRMTSKMLGKNSAVLALMLAVLIIIGMSTSPTFLSINNVKNLFWQSFTFILLTLGQLTVIISGGIDLANGAILTVSGVTGLTIMNSGPNMFWPGLFAMLAVGIVVGLINGLLVVKARMDAFIATLGISIALQGAALIITPKPIFPVPDVLKYISNKEWLGLPIILFIGILIVAIFAVLLKYRPMGRRLYAIGENQRNAHWLGLPVQSTQVCAYMVSALLAAVASIYMLGRRGAAESAVNSGMMLDSIAFSLIGGATLAGGKGSVAGSLLGVFSIAILMNILNQIGVGMYFQQIIRGVLLMGIIISYERRISKRKEITV